MPDNFQFFLIKEEAANWLESIFDKEEVKVAVFELNGLELPVQMVSPYSLFFQQFWEETKMDVMAFMREFHERGKI